MRSLCLGLLGLSLLAGCSPTTPLFIAQLGTQEVVEYKTLKTNRMTAAICRTFFIACGDRLLR